MEFLSKNEAETAQIAANFAKATLAKKNFVGNGATVVGLYGELGSGKTTFMKYLALNLGVKDTVQSPTFVIIKIYKTSSPDELGVNPESSGAPLSLPRRGGTGGEVCHLIHIDAYRIEKPEEMLNLGWRELIADSTNLICIEWPERIAGIMPPHLKIFFEHVSENERKIKIELLVANNIEP